MLCACQKSPDNAIIASKNDGAFDANMAMFDTEDHLPDATEALVHKETFFSTDKTVTFNLDIDTVMTDANMPIIEVIPHPLSEKDAHKVAQTIFGSEAQFYEAEPKLKAIYSKKEITEQIARWSVYSSPDMLKELLGERDEYELETYSTLIKEYIEYLYSLLYDLWKILVIERRKNNQIHLSLFELLWSRKEDLINIYGGSNKIKNFFLDELIDNIKTETENTESENAEEEFDDFEKTEKKTLEQIKDELKTVIHKDYDYYIYSNEDGSNTRFLEKQENTKRTITSESIIFTEPDNEEDKGKFGDLSLFATTDKDAPF